MRQAAAAIVLFALIGCSATRPSQSPINEATSGPSPTARTTAPASSQSHTPTPSNATPFPSASAFNTPTPDSTSAAGPPLSEIAVDVPTDAVEKLDLRQFVGDKPINNLVASGPTFLFSVGSDIYAGTTEGKSVQVNKVGSAQPGDDILQLGLGIGSGLAWTEGHYENDSTDPACAHSGALTWSLYIVSVDETTRRIQTGVNAGVRACGASEPMFAVDGIGLAFAHEAPTADHPQAWQIAVIDLATGATVRTIETDEDLTSIGLSGSDVAYTEGTYVADSQPGTDTDTRLMLVRPGQSPAKVADDASRVSFNTGRLAWVSDTSRTVMTATEADSVPRPLAAQFDSTPVSLAAAGDYVVWLDAGDVLVANPGNGTVARLFGTGSAHAVFLTAYQSEGAGYFSDGWLSWLSQGQGPGTVEAITLPDLLPPAPTPQPTPSPRATPIPPAAVTPPDTITVGGVTWKRFEKSALPSLDRLGGVEVTGDRFLVSGTRCTTEYIPGSDSCAYKSVLLSSSDGSNWTELGTVSTYPDAAGDFFVHGNELLATGFRGDQDNTVNGVWRSEDGGLNWDFIAVPAFNTSPCGGTPGQIVSDSSSGFTAIGSGIWKSSDGIDWRCRGSVGRRAAVFGHGTFVGVGATDTSAPEMFWQSDDGLTWREIQKTPNNTGVPVVIGSGFVAIGGAEGPGDVPRNLLTTADGTSWQEHPYPFGTADMELAWSDGIRALAIEHANPGKPGQQQPGAIWISSEDGVTWTRYELPPRQGDYAQFVALLGNTLVVTGFSDNNGDPNGAGVIWTAQIP